MPTAIKNVKYEKYGPLNTDYGSSIFVVSGFLFKLDVNKHFFTERLNELNLIVNGTDTE